MGVLPRQGENPVVAGIVGTRVGRVGHPHGNAHGKSIRGRDVRKRKGQRAVPRVATAARLAEELHPAGKTLPIDPVGNQVVDNRPVRIGQQARRVIRI